MKKRSVILASILSIITPGLGHVYNGKIISGAFITALLVSIHFLIISSGILESFAGLVVYLLILIVFYIASIIHSAMLAKKNREYELKKYNKILTYIIWFAVFLLLSYMHNIMLTVEANRTASGSMSPTIEDGDYIISKMEFRVIEPIKRGDIVLYRSPPDKVDIFVHRVIALPGETIEIKQDSIFINGDFYEDEFSFTDREGFPDSKNFSLIAIPDDRVFLLGDNRGDSYDSRFSGPVSIKDIVGKPLYIYWSKDKSKIGTEF